MRNILPLAGSAALSLAMITACQTRTEEVENPNILIVRLRFLSKDFDPCGNWWGSNVSNQ